MNQFRVSTVVLVVFLVAEIALVISLRALGWIATGNVIQAFLCVFVATAPLLFIVAIIAAHKFRFGVRTLLLLFALAAAFLYFSVLPVLNYRSERRVSVQLISEGAAMDFNSLDEFYPRMGLKPPPAPTTARSTTIPPWLEPLTEKLAHVPPDHTVRMIGVDSDRQIRLLADNWHRFPALQSIEVTTGVTDEGLEILLTLIKRYEQIDFIHVSGVAPPKNWYAALTNVRTLFVWDEGVAPGITLPPEQVVDIASLPKLETFMVLGYDFTDADAKLLSKSPSIKRIILRGTAVTRVGESLLHDEATNRLVYRN